MIAGRDTLCEGVTGGRPGVLRQGDFCFPGEGVGVGGVGGSGVGDHDSDGCVFGGVHVAVESADP